MIPDRFARPVYGYHGCTQALADELISGARSVDAWPRSRNEYDWLGHGLYFWEHGPQRAREWSLANGRDGGVVGAHIQLGRCLDLADTRYTEILVDAFESVRELYEGLGQPLPVNEGKRNNLDCLVINYLLEYYRNPQFQTVRCPFLEGRPAFTGSRIRLQSHIQISVIDSECILGVFRPNISHDLGSQSDANE